MSALPRLECRCTHRGPARERHLEALAGLRTRVGARAEPGGPAPLVLVRCDDALERRTPAGAPLGCEVVHVRVDGAAALASAVALVRGALRFAEAVGDLRGPRRGPLAAIGPPPMVIDASSCPGSARCRVCIACCPARALRPGRDGRPVVAGGACTSCGECVARCPGGALGHAHAPWAALNARLEALFSGAEDRPRALVVSERPEPPTPDGPRETVQPEVPGIVPMELPRGALRAGLVLRALELGAAMVYAVVPRDDAPCAAGVQAARALADAAGEGGRIALVRSDDEAIASLRRRPLPSAPGLEPAAPRSARRPDAGAIALSMWRLHAPRTPRRVSGSGTPGGFAAVDGEACTLCGLCVAACPTGALAERRERTVALCFDSARCPYPCGQCEAACPSRALAVLPELRLPPEQVTLVARAGTCARCGALWPEAASVAALGRRIAPGGESPALLRFVSWCPECRSGALASSLRAAEEAAASLAPRPGC